MKLSNKCPKCQSTDIVVIPGMNGSEPSSVIQILTGWVPKAVAVTRFMCGSCGYIEAWVDNEKDIATVKERFK